jgi:DNA-directed RNA polymerase subunit E'/Rpb7
MSYVKGQLRLRCAVPLSLYKNNTEINCSKTLNHLNNILSNTYTSKDGFLIKLLKIIEIKENIISDIRFDSLIIDGVYQYLNFKLDVNQMVIGVILDFPIRNMKPVALIQVGPVCVEVPVNLLPDTSYRFNSEKEQFISVIANKTISKGDEVRLKIVQKTERIHRKSGRVIPLFTGSLKGLMLGKI